MRGPSISVVLAIASACSNPTTESRGAFDAGGTLDGGTEGAPTRPVPSDFADVEIPMDFTDPVALPGPALALSGDASSLVGSWIEVGRDGSPCTPLNAPSDMAGFLCTHLDIRAGTNGGYVGTLYGEESVQNPPLVVGPFAPASDPARGYPVELSPDQYGSARSVVPGVKYRVLDGVVQDGQLTFWISPLDLWTDWCAMQAPYLWQLLDRREYRCVPQAASEIDTDLGRLALCTSAEDMPYCTAASSIEYPCVCLDETLQVDTSLPLCGLPYCECSSTECHADFRGTSVTASLRLVGDTLVGNLGYDVYTSNTIPVTLVKVSP